MPPRRLRSIAEYHAFRGLLSPKHALLSVVRLGDIARLREDEPAQLIQDFYSVALKQNVNVTLRYGQGSYGFDGGKLVFVAPGQVYSLRGEPRLTHEGWLLMFDPRLLLGTPLAEAITRYDYFGYAVDEALHLSETEEATVVGLLRELARESAAPAPDRFTRDILVAQVGSLLYYADRFYHRQFGTRQREHRHLLTRLEHVLDAGFAPERLRERGVPTVVAVAASLAVSPKYLGSVLKALTGQSTQELIQARLVACAKRELAAGEATVSEVAYGLGFAYTQSFSKLFKSKVGCTPGAWRRGLG